MTFIEDFLTQLNNSDGFYEPGQMKFAKQVNAYLKPAVLKNKNHRQALIIGAGKMTDFSLSFFIRYFDRIIVTDIDIESAKKQMDNIRLTKADKQKVIFKRIEYTGFEEMQFFEHLRLHISAFKSKLDVTKFLEDEIKQLGSYRFLPSYQNQFDFIYVSPIYTQLIYQQFVFRTKQYLLQGIQQEVIELLQAEMLQKMIDVIELFNQNLFSLLHQEGTLFVLSDVFEVENESSFYRRIQASIHQKEIMNDIYQSYQETYGMGLGDYGLYHLDQHLEVLTEKWIIWQLKQTSSFIVRCKIYNKKSIEEVSI
jgi:hypothetical protein